MREKEAFAAAEWGSMIITGFITAYVLDMVVNFVISKLPGSRLGCPP